MSAPVKCCTFLPTSNTKPKHLKILSTSISSVHHDRTGWTRQTTTSDRSRPMDLRLQDKVALIAAASRGLGRAVAEELAAEGASLVLCAREPRTLAETAAAIADTSGAHVLAVPADVTAVGDITRLVEAGTERFGRLDNLV